MALFDEVLALKVAVLQSVVQDLLIAHFNAEHDPVAAAQTYAGRNTKPPPQPDPEMEHKRQEAWNAFLDPVVAALAAQDRRSSQ
jgi:hypothetical protein